MQVRQLGTFIILCFIISVPTYADIGSDLNNFFNRLDLSTNVSTPQAYKGQQAGYYTGGSLFTRFKSRNVPVMNMQLPSLRAGCGGIDLYMGGFSYVNSDQMIALLRNIMSNATGYAFQLALEHTYPVIGNIAQKMQWLAQNVNQTNLNSCQMAESLVGGAWQTMRQGQQQVCEDIGQNQGYFADWTAARQACTTGGSITDMLNIARQDPQYQHFVIYNSNLVWQILNRHAFLARDQALAQLFMSLSGTLVIRDYQGKDKPLLTFLPPLASDETLIHALLYGGEANVYQCDNSQQCFWPEAKPTEINTENSIVGQIRKVLQGIVDKIDADTPLNPSEIGLLEASTLPLYKILTVETVFYQSIVEVDSYAEILAIDWVFQYLQEILTFVQAKIQDSQYPPDLIEKLTPFHQIVREQLRSLRLQAYNRLAMRNQFIEQTNTLEKMLVGQLAGDLTSNIQWASEMR